MTVLNNTTSPAIRTGLQAAVAEGLIRLAEVIPEPDLEVGAADRGLWLIVVTAVLALGQNFAENRMGKALLVPQRTDPPMPESGGTGFVSHDGGTSRNRIDPSSASESSP
jgi:hypothetical protein